MFNKTIDDLTFEDIEWLVQNNVTEDQRLEYKREVWGGSEANKKEMLKDIVSMANRYGGYIIIGIAEGDKGEAVNLNNIPDAEARKDEILSSLFANTQPRLQSVKIRIISRDETTIMVVSVPNSFKKPHMITFSGINQFWVRHDRQKMPMSIDEIQESIINTIDITKNMDLFFDKRKKEIKSRLDIKPFIVIGASPVAIGGEIIDIADTQLRELLKKAPNIRGGGVNFEFNYSQPHPSYYGLTIRDTNDYKEMNLYRNGYLEGQIDLTTMLEDDLIRDETAPMKKQPIIRNWIIMEAIFSFTKQLKQIYSHIGYNGQIYIYCDFYNIKNFGIRKFQEDASISLMLNLARWTKDDLEIGPLVFTDIDEVTIAKTLGDRIWQSFGFEYEPYFKDGVFTLK